MSIRNGGHARGVRSVLGGVLLVAALGLAPPAGADVYKWTDGQGGIHYTDLPPPAGATLLGIERNVSLRQSQARREAASPASTASPEALSPTRQAQLRNTVEADVAAARTEECKLAKERYDSYVRTRRLFKEGPDKERIYLTDAELAEARLEAKRELDAACQAAAELR